jgi:hypothetical protein
MEFEDFLFALVGEQRNGMPVSIISALARLNIEPWGEAKRLSDLPKDRAIQALMVSFDRLSDLQWTNSDAVGNAARLIHLLPNHDGRASRPSIVEDILPPARTLEPLLAVISRKAAGVSIRIWMAIAAIFLIATYFAWFGETTQSPDASPFYDNPVREQMRQ